VMSIQDFIVQITNEAILITIVVSLPAILLSLFIGVGVAIFSATTQIQEQSLSFVPKMIAVFAIIAITGPWIGATMMRFAER
ncbi:flagellar biosynthetic protein FliQ, partial [Mycobacterium tuberculosis]